MPAPILVNVALKLNKNMRQFGIAHEIENPVFGKKKNNHHFDCLLP